MTETRLSAMERKIDTILDKLGVIARLEERQDATTSRLDRQDGRMDSHSHRIGNLEREAAASGKFVGMMERGWWVVATAGVGLIAYFLR